MALAVCLLFDPRSERLVRGLWSRLEDAGVATPATHTHRRHHPHLSYVVLRSWDLDEVRATLESLPEAEPFEMAFHGTIAFPRGRAALAPAVADVLPMTVRVDRAALVDSGTGRTWPLPHLI